jgi:hypothetical protein
MILRSLDDNKTAKSNKRNNVFTRLASGAMAIALLTLTFTAGLGLSGNPETSTSAAFAADCTIPGADPNNGGWFGGLPSYPFDGAWPGGLSNLSPSNATAGSGVDLVGASYNIVDTNRLTAYEWYGTAGMNFYQGTWFPGTGCSIWADANNTISSLIQGFTAMTGEVLLSVVAWGLNASYLQELITGPDAVVTKIVEGFQSTLYLRWLVPLIILAAASVAWSGLVKRRGTEAIQGTIWIVVSGAIATVFFMFPTQIAGGIDRTIISIGNEITSATARASGVNATADNPNMDLCYIAPVAGNIPGLSREIAESVDLSRAQTIANREMRISQCVLWKTFIYQPWAASQFGPIATNPDLVVPKEAAATFRGNTSLPLVFLDIKVKNRSEVLSDRAPDVGFLDTAEELVNTDPEDILDSIAGLVEEVLTPDRRDVQWRAFHNVMMNDPAAKEGHANFAGVPASTRTAPVLIGFFALLFGLGPLAFLSITLVVQQIAMLLLLLLAPLALTIGIFPGKGRKIMLGWLEMFLGTVIKRFIAYALIAVLIAAMTAVMTANLGGSNYLIQVGLVIAIGFGVLNIRKVIEKRFGTVNLGGDQGSFMQQNIDSVKQGGKQTKGIMTGGVTGAVQARAKGEGGLKGAFSTVTAGVKGAREGAKTGGPKVSETIKTAYSAPKEAKKQRMEDAEVKAEKEQAKAERNLDRENATLLNQYLGGLVTPPNSDEEINEGTTAGGGDIRRPKEAAVDPDVDVEIPEQSNIGDELRSSQTSGSPVRPNIAASELGDQIRNEAATSDEINDLLVSKIVPLDRKIRGYQSSLADIEASLANGSITQNAAELQKESLNMQLASAQEDYAKLMGEKNKLEAQERAESKNNDEV